ncbi:hypothetical protein M8J76_004376 [Diaphorina citri]|nr:hypothetical protein M8J75_005256 [Diaphorina citri]KAI5740492.1 hypothetical protein M8J76_004376 [Diaphorina citri]
MFLVSLLVLTICSGVVFSAPEKYDVAKREIQSDGGYPKFPPENEELGRAQFSTKDIPVAPRHKRMDYAQALEQAQSMFSKVKEMYSSMQGSSAGGESDTEGDNLEEESRASDRKVREVAEKAEATPDLSQMSPEMIKFFEKAMELYQKFQESESAAGGSSETAPAASSEKTESSNA